MNIRIQLNNGYGRYARGMHTSIPGFSMPEQGEVDGAAELFRMLADPTRVKVMWALLQGETSVACLAELADVTPTVVSQHLAKLRLAGLVKGRREGTFVYYSPADPQIKAVLSQALFGAEEPKGKRAAAHH